MPALEHHLEHASAPLPTLSNTKSSKLFKGDKTPRPQQPVSFHDDSSPSVCPARLVLMAPRFCIFYSTFSHNTAHKICTFSLLIFSLVCFRSPRQCDEASCLGSYARTKRVRSQGPTDWARNTAAQEGSEVGNQPFPAADIGLVRLHSFHIIQVSASRVVVLTLIHASLNTAPSCECLLVSCWCVQFVSEQYSFAGILIGSVNYSSIVSCTL